MSVKPTGLPFEHFCSLYTANVVMLLSVDLIHDFMTPWLHLSRLSSIIKINKMGNILRVNTYLFIYYFIFRKRWENRISCCQMLYNVNKIEILHHFRVNAQCGNLWNNCETWFIINSLFPWCTINWKQIQTKA